MSIAIYYFFFYLTLFLNKASKLLNIIGNALESIHTASHLAILVIVIIISELCTQVISNQSTGIVK